MVAGLRDWLDTGQIKEDSWLSFSLLDGIRLLQTLYGLWGG